MRRSLKKNDKRILFFLLITAVLLGGSRFSYVFAKEKKDFIRVGLTKEFYEKPSLKINNKEVRIGFSKKDEFQVVGLLRGREGFTISRLDGSFYPLDGEYESYERARAEAEIKHQLNGVRSAIAVLVGVEKKRGGWKVYINSTDVEQMEFQRILKREFLKIDWKEGSCLVDVKEAGGYPQFEAANRNGESLLSLEGKNYRGRMEIGSYGKTAVTAVNVVRVDDYVRGVVPLEIGYTWHISALKAQAVCARSFAVATAGFRADSNLKKGYRLNNSSHQSYGGYDVEGKRPNQAVRETAGELLTYKNKVVRAYYYSSSGGATEASENVWERRQLHIHSTSDIYENKPEKKPWTMSFSKEEIRNLLENQKKGNLGEVESFEVESVSKSGRVLKLRVIGSLRSIVLKKQEIRTLFSLPSTKFEVFSGGETSDSVEILMNKGEGNTRIKGDLSGKKAIVAGGRVLSLKAKEEEGNQILTLSAKNRKGYYTGSKTEGRFYFVGSGFGHGVGMSQSGARGMAEAGYGYKKILMHYFKGAKIN